MKYVTFSLSKYFPFISCQTAWSYFYLSVDDYNYFLLFQEHQRFYIISSFIFHHNAYKIRNVFLVEYFWKIIFYSIYMLLHMIICGIDSKVMNSIEFCDNGKSFFFIIYLFYLEAESNFHNTIESHFFSFFVYIICRKLIPWLHLLNILVQQLVISHIDPLVIFVWIMRLIIPCKFTLYIIISEQMVEEQQKKFDAVISLEVWLDG